jgi:hypothetical protein
MLLLLMFFVVVADVVANAFNVVDDVEAASTS